MSGRGKPRNSNRPNATGRNESLAEKGDTYIRIQTAMWNSPHVSALSTDARALLVELASMYKGPKYSGSGVYLGIRDAAARLGLGANGRTASAAFDELIAVGLIRIGKPGCFKRGPGGKSKARTFLLAWKDEDGRTRTPSLAPLDFQKLSKAQKGRLDGRQRALKSYTKENFPVTVLVTQDAISDGPSNGFGDAGAQIRAKSPIPSTDIGYTYSLPAGAGAGACGQPFFSPLNAGRSKANGWWASISSIIERIEPAALDLRAAA